MFKTFIAGLLLGVTGAAVLLYFLPLVDQHREDSLIDIHPNHGTTESFHVNVPMDRIMIGAAGQSAPLPPGLDWPDDVFFAGMRTELFKLRNSRDAVVGVASRIAASDPDSGEIIEWVLHLPARGSLYVEMQPEAREGGFRLGALRTGTREFLTREGQVTERWLADSSGVEDAPAGRIELITAFVSSEIVE